MTKDQKIKALRSVLEVCDDLIKGYIEDLEKRGGMMNYGKHVRTNIARVMRETEPKT